MNHRKSNQSVIYGTRGGTNVPQTWATAMLQKKRQRHCSHSLFWAQRHPKGSTLGGGNIKSTPFRYYPPRGPPKAPQRYPKGTQGIPQGPQGTPKVSHRHPKGTPKVPQRHPKGTPKAPKITPKAPQRHPKCTPRAPQPQRDPGDTHTAQKHGHLSMPCAAPHQYLINNCGRKLPQ